MLQPKSIFALSGSCSSALQPLLEIPNGFYNVIPGTAIATFLWLYVLNYLPAGSAGLGLLMNPAVAVLAAWAQLGEKPGLAETVGIVLIGFALIINAIHAAKLQSQTANLEIDKSV